MSRRLVILGTIRTTQSLMDICFLISFSGEYQESEPRAEIIKVAKQQESTAASQPASQCVGGGGARQF